MSQQNQTSNMDHNHYHPHHQLPEHRGDPSNNQEELHHHLPQTTLSLIVAICLLLTIRILQLHRKRRATIAQLHQDGLPVADGASLFAGHLRQVLLRNDNVKRIDKLFHQLGKTYALFFGQDTWLMTIDVELIRRVFISEGQVHVNMANLHVPFEGVLRESLGQECGDKWRRTRRLMAPSFAPRQMKSDNVYETISQVCDQFMEFIRANNDRGRHRRRLRLNLDCTTSKQSYTFDVNHSFKRYAIEVIFRVAFGRPHSEGTFEPEVRDRLIEWLDDGSRHVAGPIFQLSVMFGSPFRAFLGWCTKFTALGSCIHFVHSVIDANLASRREFLSSSETKLMELNDEEDVRKKASCCTKKDRKMIDSLIERFEEGKMNDEALKANLFFVLLAGFETSANTLTFMFWLLAKHPHKQDRLRHALAQAGERADYLDWTLSETLRLHPAVPEAIGRVLEHDVEHWPTGSERPLRLRKGQTIVSSIWSLHRWPEYWQQTSDHFEPERFDPRNSATRTDATHQSPPPLPFFAFAAGPRYCLGQHLALAEIKTLAARILVRYKVSGGPDDLAPISPNMIHFIIRSPVELTFTEV